MRTSDKPLCSILFFIPFISACAAVKPMFLAPGFAPPEKIAVLPMSNQSNDLRGPELVRKEFVRHLQDKGYLVVPCEAVDETLRTEFGITDGGQLNSTTPQNLEKKLKVDALIYSDLVDFKFVNVGFYQNKYVEADFKMVDAKTGQLLWEDQRQATRKQIQTDPKKAADAFARGLAEKALKNALNVPLQEEVEMVVRRALSTLPGKY